MSDNRNVMRLFDRVIAAALCEAKDPKDRADAEEIDRLVRNVFRRMQMHVPGGLTCVELYSMWDSFGGTIQRDADSCNRAMQYRYSHDSFQETFAAFSAVRDWYAARSLLAELMARHGVAETGQDGAAVIVTRWLPGSEKNLRQLVS